MPLEPLAVPFGYVLKPEYRQGLVGHWKMNIGGLIIPDLSGNGNHGKRTNYNWTAASGWGGQGDILDGVNDYVSVPTNSFNAVTGAISLWVKKPTSWNINTEEKLVQLGSEPIFGANSLYLSIHNVVGLHFRRGAGELSYVYYQSSDNFNVNQWYFVTVTWDTTSANLYVDGVSRHTRAVDAGTINTTGYVGKSSASSQYFNGLIDDVRIYNRALSTDEVKHSCFQQEDEWDFGLDDISIMQGIPLELLQGQVAR